MQQNNDFILINNESIAIKNDRKPKLLSICIPVYNRRDILKECLISACEAIKGNEAMVEIVVSDNASTDDALSGVKYVSGMYQLIDILYNCNSSNLGSARNVFKVVEGASGQFCWIIGSDDFIKENSVNKLINILTENQDIDFISCSFDLMRIDNIPNIRTNLKNAMHLRPNGGPNECFKVDKLDYIVDPRYNNVLLGSIMAGIFRRELWNAVKVDEKQLDGFDSLINIYPHLHVYTNGFLGRKAYYCGQPLITVGEGIREWSTDTGNSYWESSLPVIYFKVFAEIASAYKANGLEPQSYINSENFLASFSGDLLVPILWKKYVTKEPVKSIDKIMPLETCAIFSENQIFIQTALNGLRREYTAMENQYNNMEKSFMGNILIKLFKDILENQ